MNTTAIISVTPPDANLQVSDTSFNQLLKMLRGEKKWGERREGRKKKRKAER